MSDTPEIIDKEEVVSPKEGNGQESKSEPQKEAPEEPPDYYDQLLRLKADFENYRKRVEKEKQDHRRWGKEEIILRLVSLMDVMEQAEASAHSTADFKSVVMGLDMLYKEFRRLLKEEGLEEISPKEGEAFNPENQEAVEMVESEGEENKIISILQKGYRFQSALLRPVRVRVSQKPKPPEEKKAEDSSEENKTN